MNQPTRLPRCDRVLYGADYNPDQWLGEDVVLEEVALLAAALAHAPDDPGALAGAWCALRVPASLPAARPRARPQSTLQRYTTLAPIRRGAAGN
jgi:hypothetical protein